MLGLSMITGKAWQIGAVGASVVSLALAGVLVVQTIRLADAKTELAQERAAVQEQRAKDADAWAKALSTYRQESERAIEKNLRLLAVARSDGAAAADLGKRLRDELARTESCDADGTARVGEAASASADLRANVLKRLDEAAEGIARFADESAAAAAICYEPRQAMKEKE